jgi:hypothetical protein
MSLDNSVRFQALMSRRITSTETGQKALQLELGALQHNVLTFTLISTSAVKLGKGQKNKLMF